MLDHLRLPAHQSQKGYKTSYIPAVSLKGMAELQLRLQNNGPSQMMAAAL
jgi:hypothetical protein